MDINQIMKDKPLVHDMADCKEIFWINPQSDQPAKLPFTMADIEDAEARLERFARISRPLFRNLQIRQASLNPN